MYDREALAAYFDAVRHDDAAGLEQLLTRRPELVAARWPARGNPDGMMRSLGPPPYNQHTWHPAPTDAVYRDDPRYTSTPLIWTRDDDVARVLVEHGADVNARGTSGDLELLDWFTTPLWRAAHDNRLDTVRLLVEHGADVNVLNPDGSNQALKTAAENGAAEVATHLLAQGAAPDLITAAMLGLVESATALLEQDPRLVEMRDSHGRSALDAATLMDSFRVPWPQDESHDAVARLLAARGATLNLAHAASLGLIDEVRRILQEDPNCVRPARPMEALVTGSAEFESPLDAARRRRRDKVVALLSKSA